MNIRKILITVDSSVSSLARLETGFNLAQIHAAQVTAICVVPLKLPTLASGSLQGGWYRGAELMKKAQTEVREAAEEVRQACMRSAENMSIDLNWVMREGELVDSVNREAQLHDVVILGRPETINDAEVHDSDVNGILLGCGKPCIMVPGTVPVLSRHAQNIVLAWDGSREASVALMSSFPFLEQANSVNVVTLYKHKERQETVQAEADRVAAYLSDHDIPATAEAVSNTKGSTTSGLIHYARDVDAELVVMGAYGHSRFREVMLGGATLEMLHNSPLPIVFSH